MLGPVKSTTETPKISASSGITTMSPVHAKEVARSITNELGSSANPLHASGSTRAESPETASVSSDDSLSTKKTTTGSPKPEQKHSYLSSDDPSSNDSAFSTMSVGALETPTSSEPLPSSKHIEAPLRLHYEAGEMIGEDFKVIKKLGQGGCGTVYKVETLGPDNVTLALKVGAFRGDNKDSASNEFDQMHKLKLASELKPSEYCMDVDTRTIMDHKIDRPTNYFAFAMEFIEGKDLNQFIKEDLQMMEPKQKQETIQHLMLEMAKNLQYFTDNGVAHFDMKPENTMIIKTGDTFSVKIVDYGFMRNPEIQKGNGTLLYMSPEVINSDKDPLADVWAFAAKCYFMTTGESVLNVIPNFQATTVKGKIESLGLDGYPLPTKPSTLDTLLFNTLKSTDKRWDIQQCIDFLEEQNMLSQDVTKTTEPIETPTATASASATGTPTATATDAGKYDYLSADDSSSNDSNDSLI